MSTKQSCPWLRRACVGLRYWTALRTCFAVIVIEAARSLDWSLWAHSADGQGLNPRAKVLLLQKAGHWTGHPGSDRKEDDSTPRQ